MTLLFSKFIQIGVTGTLDPLDRRKILFHNSIVGISEGILFILLAINIIFGNWDLMLINSLMIIFCVGILYLNHKHLFILSRMLFVLGVTVATITASMSAFQHHRFTGTENLLQIVIFMCAILLKGKFKYVYFLLILSALFILKYYRSIYTGIPIDANFYLLLVNSGIVALAIFMFSIAFQYIIQESISENERQKNVLFSLIDHLPLFLATVSKNGRYIMANKNYEIFGKSRDEIVGERVENVLPPKLYERHKHWIEAALNGETPTFVEHAEIPGGDPVYSAGKYVPIKDEKGNVDSVTVYAMDISDLKKAELALIETNKMKDRLLSIVAHDVKNPLNVFHSLLNIDDDSVLNQEDFKNYKEKLKIRLKGLNDNLDQILNWGLTQMDGIKAYPDSMNLFPVLKESIKHFEDYAHRKKITVTLVTEDPTTIYMDENHLRIVLRNLLHNALKFTPEGRMIYVKSTIKPENVCLEICDEGMGMKKEAIDKILAGIVQSSTQGSEGELGTGLGLSLSGELLLKNNCKLQVASTLNLGTTFKIYIPVKP